MNLDRIMSGVLFLTVAAVLPSTAMAKHPPYYRGYYRQRVVVVPPPVYVAPPPPVYVEAPPRPVYVAPVRPVQVVQPRHEMHYQSELLGVGLRVGGVALDGTKLGLSDVENPAMGGIGLQLRSRVSEHWGLELSADWLRGSGDDDGYTQTTIPVMLSALVYLFPSSAINPYGLFGGGVHFTNLSYMDGQFEHHILELAGQLGLGVQVKFGERFAIHGDVRFLTVYKNLGSTTQVSGECLKSLGGQKGFCQGLNQVDSNDKFNIGAHFQAGASYYF